MICTGKSDISGVSRLVRISSGMFAPGKRKHGIHTFMSRMHPRSITRSGGGMSFRTTYGHKPRYLVARADDDGIVPGSAGVSDGERGVWQETGLWFRLLRVVGCALMMRSMGARLWR